MEFEGRTRVLLEQAGWSPARQVDTGAYAQDLRARGYSPGDVALAFLARFGGLVVTHPHAKVAGVVDRFHLDPIRAAGHTDPYNVGVYESQVGEALTIVGEAYREHMLLLMGASGKLYAAIDEYLVLVGTDAETALTAICEGKELAPVR